MSDQKLIIGYYRLSMEDDSEGESNSIINQRKLVKDYISNVNTCYFNGQKQNSESDKLVLDFANEIIYNSRLACRKFVAFKWALGIDVLAVACIVIQFLLPIT